MLVSREINFRRVEVAISVECHPLQRVAVSFSDVLNLTSFPSLFDDFLIVISFVDSKTTEGTSKHAKAFNCVQRSHQQILETLPGYFVTVLISGLEYPVATFCFASVWLHSRMVWAKGYADSNERYSHPHSKFFWHCMLALLLMSWLVAMQLLFARKIFWDQFL